ncbi:MAG TPA: FAD-binding oxidoreductase [Gaiellaceae bacterium]|nr:FAD-binding oxidoreductase [Gaiellaceae bacterium]
MTANTVAPAAAARGFTGELLTEADAGYDEARATFNALIDRRPLAIARCRCTSDVVTALAVARMHGLQVSVRGGGHNVAGHAICDGGLVVDLSALSTVDVDPEARIARAGGGATWATFDAATQAHGLAAPGGTFSTTGVGGLTLGGGIGFLIGRYGLACDNLVAAEVVTVDGAVHVASEHEHADLFWALRGGGGNFGVVTRLDFRLHEVADVVAGRLEYDYSDARMALRVFRDAALAAPDDCSTQAFLTWDAETGARKLVVIVCSSGQAEEPEPLRQLRAAPGLTSDGVRRMPYLELQRMLELPFGLRHYWKGHFVGALPDSLLDELWEHHAAPAEAPGAVLIEAIHGAARRVPADATAVGFRDASFNVSALGIWQSANDDDKRIDWARGTAAAVAPFSLRGGGYLNYMQADEPVERVRAAFGEERFARLQAVKRRYDPANELRSNQNVPPL